MMQLRLQPNYDHYLSSHALHCTEDEDEKEWHAYEDAIANLDAAGLLPAGSYDPLMGAPPSGWCAASEA